MPKDYNIYKNLPTSKKYGQYHSQGDLTLDEWHKITGLSSVEGITYELVTEGFFTNNDLYSNQEWLFDSRRLYTGLCGYLQNWSSGGGVEGAPECFLYGLGGYCLGETLDDCGYGDSDGEVTKNFIYRINKKLAESYYFDYSDSEDNSKYIGSSCLKGSKCKGETWYFAASELLSETCIPDETQVQLDAPRIASSGWPNIDSQHCLDDWRIVTDLYVEYQDRDISTLQYHPYTSDEYLISSAPNIVNLELSLARNTGTFDINYFDGNIWVDDSGNFGEQCYEGSSLGTNEGYCLGYGFNYESGQYDGSIYALVSTWDYQKGKDSLDNGFYMPSNSSELEYQQTVNNAFVVKNLKYDNILSHQYNSPGIKEVRILAFSLHEDGNINLLKRINTRLFLGLDNVYIEDFSDLGGTNFVFLPWPHKNIPVIGGIAKSTDTPLYNSKNSNYIKSLLKIIRSNYFQAGEEIDRAFTQQSLMNDEMGIWPGKLDIQQTRVFKRGDFDMAKLLMIQENYENFKNTKGANDYNPYDDYFYWDGYLNYFPEETCVGQLFINDNLDLDKKSNCIIELNGGEFEGTYIRDSSGNSNKGILIGDYKVQKAAANIPLIRDSVIDLPFIETNSEDGAF